MPDTKVQIGTSSHHAPRPTPSSSDTSARLTPNSEDSDSNDDNDVFLEDETGLLGSGGSEADTYEMREVAWNGEKQRRGERGDTSDQEDFERVERRATSRKGYYTSEEEQAVVRKFDRRLVVFVALLYMLSFLDRSSSYISLIKPWALSRVESRF